MRESKIERYLHQQVEAAGGTTRKFVSPGRRHVPDRIVIWPGFDWFPVPKAGKVGAPIKWPASIHFIECKAPGEEPRPGQVREHKRLRALRCVVLVLDTKEAVDAYIANWRMK